ncbi:MAG: hypothetical protein D6791_08230 [Chloroflexi bacterium]|nr:MAG: hypothetical protein D6791_08230 [Chloroflexota bacterium]
MAQADVLQAIHHRLDQPWCRLVTIVGRRGAGKARLAAAVAHHRAGQYGDGVWLVPPPTRDAGEAEPAQTLAVAIAAILDLPLLVSRKPSQQVLDYLQEKEMMLVLLDIPRATADIELVLAIVQHCRGVQLLVTADEALHLRAEWVIVWGTEG